MLHTVVCSKPLVWLFSPAWDAVILSIPNLIDTNGSPAAAWNYLIRSFKLWTGGWPLQLGQGLQLQQRPLQLDLQQRPLQLDPG
jgi:hypothetical protein